MFILIYKTEHKLILFALIVYLNLITSRQLLTTCNYKHMAHHTIAGYVHNGNSQTHTLMIARCAVSMVKSTESLPLKTKNLTRTEYGIYAAQYNDLVNFTMERQKPIFD